MPTPFLFSVALHSETRWASLKSSPSPQEVGQKELPGKCQLICRTHPVAASVSVPAAGWRPCALPHVYSLPKDIHCLWLVGGLGPLPCCPFCFLRLTSAQSALETPKDTDSPPSRPCYLGATLFIPCDRNLLTLGYHCQHAVQREPQR